MFSIIQYFIPWIAIFLNSGNNLVGILFQFVISFRWSTILQVLPLQYGKKFQGHTKDVNVFPSNVFRWYFKWFYSRWSANKGSKVGKIILFINWLQVKWNSICMFELWNIFQNKIHISINYSNKKKSNEMYGFLVYSQSCKYSQYFALFWCNIPKKIYIQNTWYITYT